MASLVNSTLREAVIAALSGDTEKAQVAVAQANAAGAALGDIDLVKGLIALNAGEYDLAIALGNQSISEASTIQGPDHVAARALVFTGSFWSGTHAPVDRITPQMVERGTEIDSVLAAYSMAGISPVSSLRILSKYSGVARSPVGLFIRAQAELMVSSDSGDLEQRQSALQDLVVAQFLLRDSGHSVMWRLSSLAGTIEQAKAAGRVNDASRFAAEATPLVPLLVNVPGTEWVRWTYCRAIGDEEGMLEACRAASTSRIHLFVAAHCMTRNRDDADALRQFEELTRDKPRNTKWARLARAYLVRALPDGAARVRELVADLTSDPDALTRRLALSALCLGCSVAEVEEYAKKAAASFPPFWVGDDDLWKGDACIAYLAGKLDAEELQKTVGTGRFSLSNAHCTIGLKCLARSDRQGAFEHFQAAVATQMWGSYDYELAWAFYTRMQADSNWPHWLDEEPR
jgi:tetratricopeptide (TPR) repeat protein